MVGPHGGPGHVILLGSGLALQQALLARSSHVCWQKGARQLAGWLDIYVMTLKVCCVWTSINLSLRNICSALKDTYLFPKFEEGFKCPSKLRIEGLDSYSDLTLKSLPCDKLNGIKYYTIDFVV